MKYVDMQPHQQRVVDERAELSAKLCLLLGFIDTNPIFKNLPWEEQERLRMQAFHMRRYSEILGERIEAFT